MVDRQNAAAARGDVVGYLAHHRSPVPKLRADRKRHEADFYDL